MSKKGNLRRGILGVKTNPKKPILFSFGGEIWPGDDDDSDDSDYVDPTRSLPIPSEMDGTDVNSLVSHDDTAKDVDCRVVGEELDSSQCSLLDGQESLDSESKVPLSQKNGRKNVCFKKSVSVKREHQKQHWVVSNGTNSDGLLTMKIKLDEHSKKSPEKRKRNKPAKGPAKKVKRVRSRNTPTRNASESEKGISNDSGEVFQEGPWGKSLPLELLVHIFQEVINSEGIFPFIKRASKVCKLWQEATEHKLIWETVDLSSENLVKSEKFLRQLMRTQDLSLTKKLNLSGWGNNLKQEEIKIILLTCKKLTSINLNNCFNFSANYLKLLVDSCPDLTHIDLSRVTKDSHPQSSNNPVNSLKYVFEKYGPNLVHLNISENSIGNLPSTLKVLAKHCPNLRVLDASNMTSSSSLILPVEELQEGCPKLRVLRVANCHIALALTPLSEQVKAPGFPELEELSIAESHDKITPCVLGDNDLERLLKASHKLKLLDVRGCSNITASGLVRLPAWDIQHLYLAKCEAARTPDLELVLNKWSHSLRDVDLSWANDTFSVDQGIMSLTSMEGESPLEYVDLSGSAISYGSIEKLVLKCKRLQSLNLQSCRGLPRGYKRLYVGQELSALKCNLNKDSTTPESEPKG